MRLDSSSTDLMMLKYQSFPAGSIFQPSASSDDDTGSTTSAADMGAADRSLSRISGSSDEMFQSASSFFRVYLRSLSSEESSNSNVAIDNKIEQAMDLVKSHLMFAVREEVEILKEQIKELLEKNQQLEYENSILRADATAETLAKLQQAGPPV